MEFNGIEIPQTVTTKKAVSDLKNRINRAIDFSACKSELGDIDGSKATQAEWEAFWDRRSVVDFGVLQATESRAKKADRLGMPKVAAVIRSMIPVRDAIKAIEVVKPEPAPVDPRTLENTGTCPLCERNCKLTEDGRIVDHGYRVPSGFYGRTRGCYGVGFEPVEVSDRGLRALVVQLTDRLESLNSKHARLSGLAERTRDEQIELANVESEVRFFSRELDRVEAKIVAWQPAPLPDGRSDHLG